MKELEARLKDNPCRGIVLGMSKTGNPLQLAWIMGRSENSQNRVYVAHGNDIKTEAADPSKLKDPSLIIYNVMRYSNGAHIVSNGDQTDTLADAFKHANADILVFQTALNPRFCEPDGPVFTPRITGYHAGSHAYLALLHAVPGEKKRWAEAAAKIDKKQFKSDREWRLAVDKETGLSHEQFPTERHYFGKNLQPGTGFCLTTYKPGSKELPSFEGEPFEVPLLDNLEESMLHIWEFLEPEWRVAVCGKEIKADGTYRVETYNRFEKKEGAK